MLWITMSRSHRLGRVFLAKSPKIRTIHGSCTTILWRKIMNAQVLFLVLISVTGLGWCANTILSVRTNMRVNELYMHMPWRVWVTWEELCRAGYSGFVTRCALWVLYTHEYLEVDLREDMPNANCSDFACLVWDIKHKAATKTGFTMFTVPHYRFQLVKGGDRRRTHKRGMHLPSAQ